MHSVSTLFPVEIGFFVPHTEVVDLIFSASVKFCKIIVGSYLKRMFLSDFIAGGFLCIVHVVISIFDAYIFRVFL